MDELCPCFVRTDSLVKKRGLYIALKGGKCIAGKKPRGVGCLGNERQRRTSSDLFLQCTGTFSGTENTGIAGRVQCFLVQKQMHQGTADAGVGHLFCFELQGELRE